MRAIKEFRGSTPEMTDEAAAAARARLMTAVHEPEVAEKPAATRARRLGRRIVVAAALALAVGGAAVVFRDQPGLAPVAGVAELGERAARAAEDDPAPAPGPGQWLYTKELQLAGVEADVDRDRRETWERWTSVDGKRSAWYQDGTLMFQGGALFDPAELAEPPVTPAGTIARIEAAILDEDRRGPQELDGHVPPEILFRQINQFVSDQWLAPHVRAAIFRALPAIKGIEVRPDVPVADGRRGVAFSLIDTGARVSLVLDPRTFRYLGTNATRLRDWTYEDTNGEKVTYRAGGVSMTAHLEAKIVNGPGQRS
ncbi:CU044_5270 family protein [Nonomuraea sp. MCN248]|uniref:CU044_5270 family protein n=1 Tax=Nonomuraea corallina TaxID=2989783 RepID=A0ABT4SEY1_9ACTN|nr:CU044_5270 family protein [Nonomuraea corallina]MDA0635535.1 CU044_5270 family protein [Nonomuraea corallina]